MIGNSIQAALVEVARKLMQKISLRVKADPHLPNEIADSMYATTPTASGNAYTISVKIDAPMAAAFEYGSGIWGKTGQRYKISPKNAKALAFEYEIGKNIPNDVPDLAATPMTYSRKTGKVVLPYVMHPGVKPNPYVEPSVIENRADARQLLKRAFIESVIVRGTTKYEIRVM